MPFQPVPYVLMASMNFTLLGQDMQNTLYFKNAAESPVFPSDWQAIATGLRDAWDDTLALYVSDDCLFRNVTVTDLTAYDAPSLVFVQNVYGDNTSPPVNTGTTFTTTFRTLGRGRSFRGRNYFIGLCEGQISGNDIASTVLTATLAFYNVILSEAGTWGTGFDWGIVQRQFEGEVLATGLFHACYSVDHVDNLADYQRRRGAGRGR